MSKKEYYNTIAVPVEKSDEFNKMMIAATEDGWDLATFNLTEKTGAKGSVYMVALFKKTVEVTEA
jgi:hypothetical protein